ncbi:MAG: undecaprenyl-diphosphate phosphatase, partial [Thermoplasmatota archaeon]
AITAAGLLKLTELPGGETPEISALLIGTFTAMVVGYITIKALLALIKKGEFYKFSIYCFAVGALVLLMSI